MYPLAKTNYVIVIAILLLPVLFLGLSQRNEKKRKGYEYSSIILLSISNDSRSVYRYCDEQGKNHDIKAKDMIELCQKANVSGDGGLTRFMNYLGSKGWLLVDIDWEKYPEGTAHTYHFRRLR